MALLIFLLEQRFFIDHIISMPFNKPMNPSVAQYHHEIVFSKAMGSSVDGNTSLLYAKILSTSLLKSYLTKLRGTVKPGSLLGE